MSGYKELITFQLADLIYQLTLKFLQTFGKNLSSRQKNTDGASSPIWKNEYCRGWIYRKTLPQSNKLFKAKK